MKNIIYIILAAAIGLIAASCRETPINGNLDGQWQIMTVEGRGDSIYRPDRRYFCFYRHTANLTYYGSATIGANLTFRDDIDSLTIELPTKGTWLGPWGVPHVTPYTIRFKVLHLSRKSLIMLLDDSVTFTLRKF